MDELIPSVEAVIKVFDSLGNRKNRNKARMKFVIDRLGFEEFKRRWEDAYVAMGHARPDNGPIRLLEHRDEPTPLIMPTSSKTVSANGHQNGNGNGSHSESAYQAWKRTNTVTQRQPGYAA